MPDEARLRPEDVEVTQDPQDPTLYRFRVLLRDDLDPALVAFLQSTSFEDSGISLQPEVTLTEPVQPSALRPSTVKEVRLGPLEIKLDLGPFMKVVERLHTTYQNLVDKFAGPELMQLIEDITEGRRKPVTDFEHIIARTLLGPTRFERINEEDD